MYDENIRVYTSKLGKARVTIYSNFKLGTFLNFLIKF